jgi:transcriptional regulator GlxA family with amidase domain
MSVCTGAFIMGKAGILDSMTATTYHTQIEELQKALPKTKVLPNIRFVGNGLVISTACISAGIDGALHFVSKIKGNDFAKRVAADIEYINGCQKMVLSLIKSKEKFLLSKE